MIGIDEVGRGCWAGPMLVVAARQRTQLPLGLKDSKKLSKARREELFSGITNNCDIGEGWVEPSEIDKLGLTKATHLGVQRALDALNADNNEQIIIDGNINFAPNTYVNVKAVIKADDIFPIVSAASIAAKVLRDNFMALQANIYPEYAFEKHVGYGTAAHISALKLHGICSIHRLSYKPIKVYL